jgi:hypothetical protein
LYLALAITTRRSCANANGMVMRNSVQTSGCLEQRLNIMRVTAGAGPVSTTAFPPQGQILGSTNISVA